MNKSPTFNQDVPSEQPFSQETVQALQELGNVFRQIHRRLISEGYTIRDGEIIEPGADDANHGANR